MEDVELQQMWAQYNTQLEQAKLFNMQAWALNLQSKEALQMQKAKSKLNRLVNFKIGAVILGIIWVLFLCTLIFSRITWQGIFFNISAGMIALITVIAIAAYIYQVVLIHQVDNSESIVEAQQKLAMLQASTVRVIGIAWLQLPFYCTFYLSPALLQKAGTAFIVTHAVVFIVFCLVSAWVYRNIRYKNRNKKWFKILFSSFEWTAVVKAIRFLEEVEEFKKGM